MEKKWTIRDTLFAIIGIAQVVLLVVLLMKAVQADRHYDRLDQVIDRMEQVVQKETGSDE